MKFLGWGANTYGQLGIGIKSELSAHPIEVTKLPFNLQNIRRIVGGGGHTLVLDQLGKVYSCGWNNRGQLGSHEQASEVTFELIESLSAYMVVDICCGWDSSFAVTDDGKLVAWGSNLFGQLGVSKKEVQHTSVPFEINIQDVHQVSSGLRHTAVVTHSGRVLLSGSGRKGQLGITDENGSALKECDQFTEDGGILLCWGRNSYGQLGCYEVEREESWRTGAVRLERVRQVEAGSEHTIAIPATGGLTSWGWNEHGNCGLGTTGDIKKPTNVKVEGDVILVGTGAAHSFAIIT